MGQTIKYCSDFLFANNDLITGIGSNLNIWGGYFEYNRSRSSNEADRRAMLSDWLIVGQDFNHSAQLVKDNVEAKHGVQLEFNFE